MQYFSTTFLELCDFLNLKIVYNFIFSLNELRKETSMLNFSFSLLNLVWFERFVGFVVAVHMLVWVSAENSFT